MQYHKHNSVMKPAGFSNSSSFFLISYRVGLKLWWADTVCGHKHQLGWTSGSRRQRWGGDCAPHQSCAGLLMGTSTHGQKPNLRGAGGERRLVCSQQESCGAQGLQRRDVNPGWTPAMTGEKVWWLTGYGHTGDRKSRWRGLCWAWYWVWLEVIGLSTGATAGNVSMVELSMFPWWGPHRQKSSLKISGSIWGVCCGSLWVSSFSAEVDLPAEDSWEKWGLGGDPAWALSASLLRRVSGGEAHTRSII